MCVCVCVCVCVGGVRTGLALVSSSVCVSLCVCVSVYIVCHVCLSYCSITVKRHHDQDNSDKDKHLIGAGLPFQRFSSLSLW